MFYSHLLIFTKWFFFMNTIRVPNILDQDQAQQFGLIWVETVCKSNQQTTLVGRVKLHWDSEEFFHLCETVSHAINFKLCLLFGFVRLLMEWLI